MKLSRSLYVFFSILLLVLIAFGVVAYKAGLIVRYDSVRTLHSPIFSSNGSEVYLLSRESSGISWGPGIEFFTPPAKVIFLSDRISLIAVERATKKVRQLYSWDIPHEKEPRKEYRNRLFGIPGTELRLGENKICYKIGLDILKDAPNTRNNEWLTGCYDIAGQNVVEVKKWEQTHEMPDQWPEEILFGDYEVINYRNKAVLIHEGKTNAVEVLQASGEFSPEELKIIPLGDYSHRRRLERLRLLRETNKSLIEKFRAEGLSEGEAMLRAGDELEKMGLYPKTPKIAAQSVVQPGDDHEVFSISKEEFFFGLFQDIEKAIQHEGKEVRFWGNYVTHRDYDTSRILNAYLSEGNAKFYVTTEGRTYLMTIHR